MDKPKSIGVVTEVFPDSRFRVMLTEPPKEILAYMSGKMKINRIHVILGDKVQVEVDPYGGKATSRITRRL